MDASLTKENARAISAKQTQATAHALVVVQGLQESAMLTSDSAECEAAEQAQGSANPLVVPGLQKTAPLIPGLEEHTGHATSNETLLLGAPETELNSLEISVMQPTSPSLLEATAQMGQVRIMTCAYGHAYTNT